MVVVKDKLLVLPWACVHKYCSWPCSAPSSASTRSGWGRGLQEGWCCNDWLLGWLLPRRLPVGGAPCSATAPSRSPATPETSRRSWLCMSFERDLKVSGLGLGGSTCIFHGWVTHSQRQTTHAHKGDKHAATRRKKKCEKKPISSWKSGLERNLLDTVTECRMSDSLYVCFLFKLIA